MRTFEKYKTPLNISMEMPTLEAIKRLVEQGMGVALVPRLTAQAEIASKQVVALTVREMRLERGYPPDLPQGRNSVARGPSISEGGSGKQEAGAVGSRQEQSAGAVGKWTIQASPICRSGRAVYPRSRFTAIQSLMDTSGQQTCCSALRFCSHFSVIQG